MAAVGSHNYINIPASYRTLGCLLPGTTLWLQWAISILPLWLITQYLQQPLRTRLNVNKAFDRNLTALSKGLLFLKDWFIALTCTNVYMNFPLKLFQIPVYMRLLT